MALKDIKSMNLAELEQEVAGEERRLEEVRAQVDRELGLEIAKANFHGNYDVVISRGDTATMLRRDLSIPVVEIEVSMYDLLCTLKLAGSLSGAIAFVAAVFSTYMSARNLGLKMVVLNLVMVAIAFGYSFFMKDKVHMEPSYEEVQ